MILPTISYSAFVTTPVHGFLQRRRNHIMWLPACPQIALYAGVCPSSEHRNCLMLEHTAYLPFLCSTESENVEAQITNGFCILYG